MGVSGLHLDYGRQFGQAPLAVIKTQPPFFEPCLQDPPRKNEMVCLLESKLPAQ